MYCVLQYSRKRLQRVIPRNERVYVLFLSKRLAFKATNGERSSEKQRIRAEQQFDWSAMESTRRCNTRPTRSVNNDHCSLPSPSLLSPPLPSPPCFDPHSRSNPKCTMQSQATPAQPLAARGRSILVDLSGPGPAPPVFLCPSVRPPQVNATHTRSLHVAGR